jgi:uroporphyrin-III C-methyltransferase
MHNEHMEKPDPVSHPAVNSTPPATTTAGRRSRRFIQGLLIACVLMLIGLVMLWQKLEHIQSELARRSTDSTAFAMEARATAKAAQDTARETAARLGVTESRLAEVGLQRSQLDELVQSLSRSRDENLIVDIEAALRLAQQQSQMLGSSEPLLAALKSAEQRLARLSQPRLLPIARAITRDQDRLKAAKLIDISAVTTQLDEIVRQIDELPLTQDLLRPAASEKKPPPAGNSPAAVQAVVSWSENFWQELRSLVRIRRLDNPDAALLSPQQSYFVRENLKLKLLNARLGLLSRQFGSAGADLHNVQATLTRHFDASARSVSVTRERLGQIQAQLQNVQLPRIDDTLAALTTAAAGK